MSQPRTVLQTPTGQPYVVTEPSKTLISTEDISLALSRLPRFGGRFSKHVHWYSYAQHSVLVSCFCRREHAKLALLHDADRAYIQNTDEAQGMGEELVQLKNMWLHAIAKKFKVSSEKLLHLPDDVKQAHTHVENLEQMLMARSALDLTPSGTGIIGLTPRLAQTAWIDRLKGLK